MSTVIIKQSSSARGRCVSGVWHDPPGGGTNEPVGYTMLFEQPFTTLPSNGYIIDLGTIGNNMDFVSDASAPESPSSILRFTYPTGYTAGSAPGAIEHSPINKTEFYRRIRFRHSANWYAHSSATNKMGFVWCDGGPMFFFNANGTANGTLTADLTLQGNVSPWDSPGALELHALPNTGQPGTLSRGDWHMFEVQCIINSSGSADGVMRAWVDGVHTHEYTNIQFVSGSGQFEYVSVYPIWGGTGGTTPVTQTWDIDHDYVSAP